jgi:hypothetical protein
MDCFKKLALNDPRLEELANQGSSQEESRLDNQEFGPMHLLSLSDIRKNEPMLKVVYFFWSNTYNAFFFRQGPMSPTFADVHMLTCLNIAGHINPFSLLVTPTAKLGSTKTGGWSQYIINHKADGRSVSDKEHTAFWNMWLDRYVFCGQVCSPTSNYLTLAEKIQGNSKMPLGKILLGVLYNLLNRISQHLM